MIADNILATILERPGISAEQIRAAFPNVNPKTVGSSITLLRDEGWVECTGRGVYRPVRAVAPTLAPTLTPMPPRPQSSIAPAPMARLMAGR